MKVYIDIIILLNFMYDILINLSTSILLKRETKLKRIILSSLIGEVSLLTLFISFSSFSLIIFKILLSIIMVLISFGHKHFLENIFYFYIITIILGGSSYLIKGSNLIVNIILICLISPIICYLYIKEMRVLNIKYKSIYDVIIIDGNNTYKLKGYLDTGNNLVDSITNYPVILVPKTLNISKNKLYLVPYRVLNDSNVLSCYKVDKVLINNKVLKVLVGLAELDIFTDDINCILNNSLREMI